MEFSVGDRVEVLRASRRDNVIGVGVIERITGSNDTPLYWVSGFPMARTADVLRLDRVAREVAKHYPPDWPKCHCGLPVMDGHLTCGKLECDEGGTRRRVEEARRRRTMETTGGSD
jgi:hypothetical protein